MKTLKARNNCEIRETLGLKIAKKFVQNEKKQKIYFC